MTRHLLLYLLSMCFCSLSVQAQKGLQLGGFGSAGPGSFNANWERTLTPVATSALGYRAGIDVAYFFHPNIGIATGLGFGVTSGGWELNSFANDPVQIDAATSAYFLQNGPNLAYVRQDTINGLTENWRMASLEVPVLLRFRAKWIYAEVGPIFSFPLSATYDGTGEISYSATFSDVGTSVYNTGFGFQNYAIQGTGDLSPNGLSLSFWGGLGVNIPLSEKTEIRVGAGYRLGSNLLTSSNNPDAFFNRSEGDNQYYPLADAASSVRHGMFSGQVGIYQTLGAGTPRPPKEKNRKQDCAPSELSDFPLEITQTVGTSREANKTDLDLLELVKAERASLNFKHAQLDESGYKLLVCMTKTDISAVETRFKKGNPYLALEKSSLNSEEGVYELNFNPLMQSAPIRLIFRDQNGASISQAKVGLFLNDNLIFEQVQASAETFTRLYQHPSFQYELRLQASCFEETTIALSPDQDFSQPVIVEMNKIGGTMALDFNVDVSQTTFSRIISIEATLNQGGLAYVLEGTMRPNGQINMQSGCAPSPSGSYQLSLIKPVGFDLYRGGNTGNWASEDLIVDIRNGRPVSSIKARRLPQYHVFYIELSEVENRYLVMDSLDRKFQRLKTRGDSILIYMSNGNNPTIATRTNELEAVIEMMYVSNPDIPNAVTEKAALKERIDLAEVIPDRRQVVINYIISNSLYRRSRSILIDELSRELNLDREKVQFRIYTEQPIFQSDQFSKSEFPNLKYIRLVE